MKNLYSNMPCAVLTFEKYRRKMLTSAKCDCIKWCVCYLSRMFDCEFGFVISFYIDILLSQRRYVWYGKLLNTTVLNALCKRTIACDHENWIWITCTIVQAIWIGLSQWFIGSNVCLHLTLTISLNKFDGWTQTNRTRIVNGQYP